MIELMKGMVVHHLRFTVRSRNIGSLGAQPGSALRGSLYRALSRQFCPDRQAVHLPGHKSGCPVCRLLAAEDADNERGQDLPRPLTVEPPSSHLSFKTGQLWQFGISLIGASALEAFPYLVRAVQNMGVQGVSYAEFDLMDIVSYHPFTGEATSLVKGSQVVMPLLPVTGESILIYADQLPTKRLKLEFLTPLRIVEGGHPCHILQLDVLIRRLIERCQALAVQFSDNEMVKNRVVWRELSLELSQKAEQATLINNETHWLDVKSGSQRANRLTPIGGLVGCAEWTGDFPIMLPWLLWGQSLHVGKSAVKGNGWYLVGKE